MRERNETIVDPDTRRRILAYNERQRRLLGTSSEGGPVIDYKFKETGLLQVCVSLSLCTAIRLHSHVCITLA